MAKKTEKKSKSESKTPELTKAKKALDAYLKENKLDPTKDWTKDKKHGKKVTELVNKLNKERDKVAAAYPEADQENNKKLVKLQEKEKKEKAEKKAAKEKKEKKAPVKEEKKAEQPKPVITNKKSDNKPAAKSVSKANDTKKAKTGDNNNVILFLVMFAAAVAMIGVITGKSLRRNRR